MALQSARILPLTDLITWKYARVPGSNLAVVNLVAAVETTSYASRDFELQYRDLIVAGALAEVSLKVSDVWGMGVDRVLLPVIPTDALPADSQDLPALLEFPGAVDHVVPSDTPQAAVTTDKDLYGRDVILWETLARAASILEEPPIESISSGLVLSDAWSLGEGDDVPDTVNAAIPLSVDLFKNPDKSLADRDNQLGAVISRVYEALADVYGRATRLLVKIDDSDLNRDPDQYVLYSDDGTERIWITTPGLTDRSRIIFNKITRQVTWVSNYYTEQGSAPAAMSTSFGAVNDFSVKARVPTKSDCEFYRQKTSQFKIGRYQEVPVYSQPAANVDYAGGNAAFLGPDDIMLSSDGSYADLSSGTSIVPGVYRFGFLYETRRTVRLFGALNDNPWPAVSATASTMTTSGEMTWSMKLEAGSYTLKVVFADLTANTPNFGIEIQYNETSVVTVYDGLLLYGYSGGKYITSPTYVLTSNGAEAVLTFRRTDNNAGQLTVDRIEISPASSDILDFDLEVTNGTTTLPAKIYGVPGRFGCAYFDFPLADSSDVRIGLSALALGAIYIKGYDIKKIELQRETPDIDGYRGWKRGWLEKALESVRQSWFTSTKLETPSFLEDGLWTPNSTENWMNAIESVETRLRSAFRVARPSDIGQPALTPMGLSIDDANAVSLYDETRLEPVLQALQPWMIRVGAYVASEDFWPAYYVANAAGLSADFDAVALYTPPDPAVMALSVDSIVKTAGDTINFEPFVEGEYSEKTLVVQNDGEANLYLLSLGLAGTGFSLQSGVIPSTIPGGDNASFVLRASSDTPGSLTGSVTPAPYLLPSVMLNLACTVNSACSNALSDTWADNVILAGGTYTPTDLGVVCAYAEQLIGKSYYSKIRFLLPFAGQDLAAAKIPLINLLPDVYGGGSGTMVLHEYTAFSESDYDPAYGMLGGAGKVFSCGQIKGFDLLAEIGSAGESSGALSFGCWLTKTFTNTQSLGGWYEGFNQHRAVLRSVAQGSNFELFSGYTPFAQKTTYPYTVGQKGLYSYIFAHSDNMSTSFYNGVALGAAQAVDSSNTTAATAYYGCNGTWQAGGAPFDNSGGDFAQGLFFIGRGGYTNGMTAADLLDLYETTRDYLITPLGRN